VPKVEEAYRISADQLIETSGNRKIIPCTISSDIGLSGGIPLGATVVLAGKSKAGKTTFSLQCAANAQAMYGSKVFFFNIEGRLSKQVLSQIRGLKRDLDHFEVIMPPVVMSKSDEIISHKKWYGEQWWDEIGKTIQDNPGCIIIVDSIANMSSEKEVSEEMGYQDRGARQKLEAQFCRKYGDLVVPNQVCLFLLTQIQANTSGYGSPVLPKVGNSIKHQADIIMFCKKVEQWKPDNTGRSKGHNMIYQVDCSAMGPPMSDVSIPLRYAYGIDNIQDVINYAVELDIIKKGGAWYSLPFLEIEDEKFKYQDLDSEIEKGQKPVKVQGEVSIRHWLIKNPDHYKKLESIVRTKIFGDETT